MWVTGGVPVTHLRKIMLEELQRRNYAQHTTRSYIRAVEDFARYFNCSPDRLGPRHIREYQAELFEKRKLSAGSVAVRLAALRFFYCKTLRRAWSIADTPYPKGAHRLPAILSQEEVAQLIQAAGCSSPIRCARHEKDFFLLGASSSVWDCRLIRRPAKDARRKREPCLGRVQEKELAFRKIALESTLPLHNGGAGRRVSERTESCTQAQRGSL